VVTLADLTAKALATQISEIGFVVDDQMLTADARSCAAKGAVAGW
jgi:hypothetical protein